MPRKGRLFGEGVPPASAADYTVGGYAEISPDAASRHAAVYYIPENRQGSVPGIVTQQQKNLDNAPEHAVFLLIRALRGSRVLDYRVYLGENNTTDFNVRPNTHHTLDICILGDNEVDTRVHGYTLTVWDDLAAAPAAATVRSIRSGRSTSPSKAMPPALRSPGSWKYRKATRSRWSSTASVRARILISRSGSRRARATTSCPTFRSV